MVSSQVGKRADLKIILCLFQVVLLILFFLFFAPVQAIVAHDLCPFTFQEAWQYTPQSTMTFKVNNNVEWKGTNFIVLYQQTVPFSKSLFMHSSVFKVYRFSFVPFDDSIACGSTKQGRCQMIM